MSRALLVWVTVFASRGAGYHWRTSLVRSDAWSEKFGNLWTCLFEWFYRDANVFCGTSGNRDTRAKNIEQGGSSPWRSHAEIRESIHFIHWATLNVWGALKLYLTGDPLPSSSHDWQEGKMIIKPAGNPPILACPFPSVWSSIQMVSWNRHA